MKTCLVTDLGLAEYASVRALEARVVAARKAGAIPDVLLLCEHPHVITQGRNGRPEHLLASRRLLDQMGVAFFETNRGGDITYHGPGQVVGYPIVDLSELRRDVRWYVCGLEEAMIHATAEYGVATRRVAGKIGVWTASANAPEEKLAGIGVHMSRWVTSHGFAYNAATDLRYFDLIVPCGIADRKATSLEKVLGWRVSVREVSERITKRLGETLGLEMKLESPEDLAARLRDFENGAANSAAREAKAMV